MRFAAILYTQTKFMLKPQCSRNQLYELLMSYKIFFSTFGCCFSFSSYFQVHGLFVASMFGGILGSQFPGSIYMLQNLLFKAPCYVGSSVTARLEVFPLLQALSLLAFPPSVSSQMFFQVSNINVDRRVVIWRSTVTVRYPLPHALLARTHSKNDLFLAL